MVSANIGKPIRRNPNAGNFQLHSGDLSDLAGDGDKLVMDLGALDEFTDGLFMSQQEIDNMAAFLDGL
jgi:hypothetical protein